MNKKELKAGGIYYFNFDNSVQYYLGKIETDGSDRLLEHFSFSGGKLKNYSLKGNMNSAINNCRKATGNEIVKYYRCMFDHKLIDKATMNKLSSNRITIDYINF